MTSGPVSCCKRKKKERGKFIYQKKKKKRKREKKRRRKKHVMFSICRTGSEHGMGAQDMEMDSVPGLGQEERRTNHHLQTEKEHREKGCKNQKV
jgi:hypothetical protein